MKAFYKFFGLVLILIILTWIIMFKANLLTSDLRFGYRSINLIPFLNYGGKNGIYSIFTMHFLLNSLVFIPLGAYIYIEFGNSLAKAILFTLITSILFEAMQYILAFGSTEITDCISNTVGGLLGALIAVPLRSIKLKNLKRIILFILLIVAVFAIISTIIVFPIYIIK